MTKELKRYSREEIAKHNKPDDLWIIIDSYVYDLSDFIDAHPGGEAVLLMDDVAGQDATETFFGLHAMEVLMKPMAQKMIIGQVEGEEAKVHYPKVGELSKVPYAEPSWLVEPFHSPYYNESHRRFQKAVRVFCEEHVFPVAEACEANGKRPDIELIKLMGENGLNAMRLGPGKHLHGRKLLGDVKPEEFDYFHELIITQELCRCGCRGFVDGLQGGMVIGLPPILNFGSDEMKKEIVEPVFRGEKFISLAITEAFAGSDVMGLRTFAQKTEDGQHYIVNGTKKWITNGHFADYFTTAVRTEEGFAVLLIPRSLGVKTRLIHTSYSSTAGTAFVMFNNIKVPAKNLIGADGMGIPIVLSNFNHERWVMCCGTIRGVRGILEILMKWIHQRKVFGRPLTSQAVVRQKIAFLLAQAEAAQSYLEHLTFQMNNMSYKEQAKFLAGPLAFLKAWSTRVSHEVADNAVQIMGGRGLTRSGMGRKIENYNRNYKYDAVLGGTEEILADLGIRQALRFFPNDVKL
ncbi:unnamed protein product [Malassezia sympodialis ATCC 42132]|uniref:Similar to S.cerevisiae protein CYB5 (Cytochrome b5) n=1 Tax=Malassezia sympodialis (strain ATCC 42132) TaxID=1230383 RepID=M5E522_MALS4|nr:uncharacterized protein MSY001_0182 [Malassezia sympodialis ATCC 42132]CCU97476.1 unnamed protein product [Malassezia sympodialis ATCC 42132]SHO77130.1 Similar to S.cerevisiae protein CYB5 (Cytochrome b5) [Malassezia sympodialis ATCC 42132]|eukprot:XP_018738826.1 uncharacterized protein MSY001_0182 [Malassezia sympodialis ATCC 42132]